MRILKLPPYYAPEQTSSAHLVKDLPGLNNGYVFRRDTVKIFSKNKKTNAFYIMEDVAKWEVY